MHASDPAVPPVSRREHRLPSALPPGTAGPDSARPAGSGSRKNLVSTPEERPQLGLGICKLSVPGEAEAGSAGTQPCRGIVRWADRDDENGGVGLQLCAPSAHRTIDPHASENPGGLGAGPQIKKSPQYLVVFLRRRVFTIQGWSGPETSKIPHAGHRPDRRPSSINDFKRQKFSMKILRTSMELVSSAPQPEKKKAPGCSLRLENPCHQPTF